MVKASDSKSFNRKIAVITEKDSDILKILRRNNINLDIFKPGQIICTNLDVYYSIAILGGVSDTPIMFHPKERLLIEEQLKNGKKIFAEYCGSIEHIYCEPPVKARFERLAFCSTDVQIGGLEEGDLLDDQCGMRIKPYKEFCSHNTPILQYVFDAGHDKIQNVANMKIGEENNISDRALWFNQENLLISSFCLANYNRARFAPKYKFKNIIKFILEWLTDINMDMSVIEEYYYNNTEIINTPDLTKITIENSIEKGMEWFNKANIILDDGKNGVIEGLATEIYPDGTQRVSTTIRTDCVGEVSLAYFMYSLMNRHKSYHITISDNLASICFDLMQCKEKNEFHGMMRWTQEAWGVCYQDDVARAVIPQMLKCLYTRDNKYLQECVDALDFLVRTTGTDGTRPFRTDNINLNTKTIDELVSKPGNFPSAHYNAYYHAALLLAYKLTQNEKFKFVAVKGLETIMSVYPDTIREQSQTQELCRLILPLSWLYWVTREEKHKDWLYAVTKDLQKFKHKSGAYLEWDEGYKASMRNKAGEGESSLLSSNGDPVVDLLYSNNWLPIGFIQAYFVTGDKYFKNLWKDTAKFMAAAQIHSQDDMIDGAWARGFDVNYMEVFGSPADVGWGPWAIESGWTVAEIISGLIMGLMEDTLIKYYK